MHQAGPFFSIIIIRNFMKESASLLVRKDIDDAELARIIGGAKKNDAEAMERLSRYAYARIYHFMYYRVSHREDAEDLTSEVVLRMVRSLKKQRGNFHAWMYKIARNALIDFYRRRAVRSEMSLSDMENEVPDKGRPLSEQVLTVQKLRQGMQHLTEEQRQVILLKFIEGHNNDEIARIMGKSIGAIKVLQYRAVKALRKYFRKKGYEVKD